MTTALNSSILRMVATQLRRGRHPLVVGNVGDLVLLQGEAMSLSEALRRQAASAFDVVVRLNAADGLDAVWGSEHFATIAGCGSRQHHEDTRVRDLQRHHVARSGRPGHEPMATVRQCLEQDEHSVLVLVEQADILLQDPAHHDELDRERVANLRLGLDNASRAGRYHNTCVLLAGDNTAVPPVLLAGAESVEIVDVPAPSLPERAALLRSDFDSLPGVADLPHTERAEIIDKLSLLTEGDTLRHLESLMAFSRTSNLPPSEARTLVTLHRFGDQPDYWSDLTPRLDDCARILEERVVGQEHATRRTMSVLAAGALGLRFRGDSHSREGQPRGVLWFVGPTGVGKTELAKALAEAVFGDAEAYVRLDMSTFAQEHAAERLMGSPPGYVGHEQGGELTNAVRQRPNSVILLDEIEKAHPRALDRFMSIFDDGHITDAQGRVTYFNNTVIIATSNLGARAITDAVADRGDDVTFDEISSVALDAVRHHFMEINRPEIFGRIEPGIVPFDIIRGPVIDSVVERFVAAVALDNGPSLDIHLASTQQYVHREMEQSGARALGGRQVRNILQARFRELASWLVLADSACAERVEVRFDGAEMVVALDDQDEVRIELSGAAGAALNHGN